MENNNEIYINILKQAKELLSKEVSLEEIQEFLRIIDDISYNLKLIEFEEDFLIIFYEIMNKKINDTTSLGDFILNDSLEKIINLPPSLLIYFYLKEKDKLGFKDSYNKFKICSVDSECLAYTDHDDDKHMFFNFNKYKKDHPDSEEHNYECMEAIMHEIAHIYQFSISPDTEDVYEMLIYHDRQVFDFCRKSKLIGYMGLHDYYAIENYANNFSKQFIINLAKTNPNYFNENIIMRKKDELLKYSNKWFYESYRGARFHFYYLIENIIFDERFLNGIEEQNPMLTEEYIEEIKKQMNELERKEWQIVDYIDHNMPDSIEKVYLGINQNSNDYIDEYNNSQKDIKSK